MAAKPNDPSGKIPKFIQTQLKFPPISKSEDPQEFRSMFDDLAASSHCDCASDYILVLQATILSFRVISLQKMRAPLAFLFGTGALISYLTFGPKMGP